MNTPRKILYIVSLIVIVLYQGCGSEEIKSSWAQAPPVVDGHLSEWRSGNSVSLGDHRVVLEVQNDTEYLYLACRVNDPQTQRAIEERGVTIWIDPNRNEQKELALHYPASNAIGFVEGRGGFWNLFTKEQRDRAVKKLDALRGGVLVTDRRAASSRLFAGGIADTFAVVSSMNTEPLTIEARVPLRLDVSFPHQHPVSNTLSLGIRLEGISGQASDRPGSPFSGGPQMGSGRKGLSRQRGPSSAQELWVTIELATRR